jgi:flagellin-like hook-associated protein FlgL
MRVTSRMNSLSFLSDIMSREAEIQKKSSQYASGVVIQRPSDDPIGTARTMLMNSSIYQIKQYTNNSQEARTWLNSADKALQSVDEYLQRAYELLERGANSTLSDEQRIAIAEEIDQICSGIMEVANTNIDNRYIFAGTDVTSIPYNLRVSVSGNPLDLHDQPIVIDASNNRFQLQLDDGTVKTIVLPVESYGAYDGTSGKTLNDLTKAIQKQLDVAGFAVPVSVKMTPDNKITFYAGTTPPDGKTHTVVLRNAVTASGNVQAASAPAGIPPTIVLDSSADATDDFYTGNTVTFKNSDGTLETRKIVSYDGATRTATLDEACNTAVSATSTYDVVDSTLGQLGFADQATTRQLVGTSISSPVTVLGKYPLTGQVASATGSSVTLTSDATATADFYKNWTITIVSGPGAGQTQTITGYDGTTKEAALSGSWSVPLPDATSVYSLSPPLEGTVSAASADSDKIYLDSNAITTSFYMGMPITITDGAGQGQTRTIKSVEYDSVAGKYYAKLDSPLNTLPDASSKYSINANYFANEDNRFKISLGQGTSYEISLDSGTYSLTEFAAQLEKKIQNIGGDYANIKVSVNSDNQLSLVYQDPSGANKTLPIKLESGSSADILDKMGFISGDHSDQARPNYEGDYGSLNYEINVGVSLGVNQVGADIFDSIFTNLSKFSQDLRTGDLDALGDEDIRLFKQDQQKVLVAQSQIGTKVNRLESGITRMSGVEDYLTSMMSTINDTEYARIVMELKTQQAAYDAALQISGQLIPKTLLDYLD